MASPKLEPIVLTDDERQVLQGWARRRKTAQALALRSRIVLACADGGSVSEVAASLGISRATAGKWRSRFLASRLKGLGNEPRPGRPRTITDEHIEQVIAATLEQEPPNGDTHWSTRSMARTAGLNQTAVSRIWRAFGLKPHSRFQSRPRLIRPSPFALRRRSSRRRGQACLACGSVSTAATACSTWKRRHRLGGRPGPQPWLSRGRAGRCRSCAGASRGRGRQTRLRGWRAGARGWDMT